MVTKGLYFGLVNPQVSQILSRRPYFRSQKKSSRAKHLTRFYQSLTLPKDPTCLYLFSFCKAIMFIQLRFNSYFSLGCQHPTCGGFVEHINLIIVFSSVRLNDPKLTTKVSVQKKELHKERTVQTDNKKSVFTKTTFCNQ